MDVHVEYYGLLRTCLQDTPSGDLIKALAEQATDPPQKTNYEEFSEGWNLLDDFFKKHTAEEADAFICSSYNFLLGDPFKPKLEAYASQYINGNRQGAALVDFRRFLRKWELVPEKNAFKDFEDHVVFVLDTVVQISHLFEQEGGLWEEALEECLSEHVIPWMPLFFKDLEREDMDNSKGGFYAGLAKIGQAILASEAEVLQ